MNFLELAALALDSGLLVLIWLVQLVIYPAFHEVREDRFRDWHAVYSRRVSWVVIPLMFGQLGVTIAFFATDAGWLNVVALVFVAIAWGSTFLQAVPLHRKLSQVGDDPGVIDRLIRVNRVRVVAWTCVWLASVIRLFTRL